MEFVRTVKTPKDRGLARQPIQINKEWYVECYCGADMVLTMLPYPEYLRGCDIPNCISCATPRFKSDEGAFYSCVKDGCEGLHGAERNGRPMGVPSSPDCAKLRHYVHLELDSLWKGLNKHRGWGYGMLSKRMKLPIQQTHAALFDITQCKLTIKKLRQYKNYHGIKCEIPN